MIDASGVKRIGRRTASGLLALACLLTAGCGTAGYIGYAIAGGDRTVKVSAVYRGLTGKSIAVLVSADDATLYASPRAAEDLGRAVTARLANFDPTARLTDPAQIDQFKRSNLYWFVVPPGQLLEHFQVERLVVIDLSEYRTREPGNAEIWAGFAAATVKVFEAEAPDRNLAVLTTSVQVRFPEDHPVGLLDATDEQIRFGLARVFSREVVRLFHDHEIVKTRHDR